MGNPRAAPAARVVGWQALCAMCLWLAAAPAPAVGGALGDPPVAPAPTPARVPAKPAPVLGYDVYLPVIARGQPGLFVNPHSRQESLSFYLDHYLTSVGAPINWTGSQSACVPGATDPAFRAAVLQRVNYFRAMAGVPANIAFSDDSNRLAQAAALMMSANGQLSHTPPSNWACYSADGAAGAGSSDLYLGVYGWDAISGYMKDPGSGNDAMGHRRWILYPQTQVMGTGDIPPVPAHWPANALRVFDGHMWEARPPTREEFVAWPPPGYVPYEVVFPRWSISLANADFSAATVAMTSNSVAVALVQAPVVNGYGENTLGWIPLGLNDSSDWPVPASDTAYDVTIKNVVINNQSRDFAYTVTVFNPGP